jgi:hypothetical protein
MTPQHTRSRRSTRLLAIAAATAVAVGGTIGLAFAADSDNADAVTDKPAMTAPASPEPTVGTHWPSPPPPADSTREDGGPEEGSRGPSAPDSGCVDPSSGGNGPQHC